MKKDRDEEKDKQHREAHHGHHHAQRLDPLKTEHHDEHVAFLKDRYGMDIHKSD